MARAIGVVFFVSGAAALLFETLWFRQVGLALGNSVWAAAIVTASFMAGLALGGAMARRIPLVRGSALLTYARLEVVVALSGVAVVLSLPALWPVLALASTPLAEHVMALSTLRVVVAFAVLAVPATALGATLPVLVAGLRGPAFATRLGWLYGCNTLGAVAGALAGEFALIGWLGVRGTAAVAAVLDLLAAATAWRLEVAMGRNDAAVDRAEETVPEGTGRGSGRWLVAAALAGGVLLALETLWLRLLLLFVCGTSAAFAVELSSVLLGIGAGGLLVAWWTARGGPRSELAAVVALFGGVATAASYAFFRVPGDGLKVCGASIASVALPLVLPTALVSGLLFPLIGDALRAHLPGARQSAGALVAANTSGALLGGWAGAFLLLPGLGLERSIYLCAAAYGVVAVCLVPRIRGRGLAVALGGAALTFATALAVFPFGRMGRELVPAMLAPWRAGGRQVVAFREGLTETSVYLRDDAWRQPVAYRLITNGFSMAGTGYNVDRYTQLFVHWAVAMRPAPRRALLVCYGVGSTASALVKVPSLERIDVVDISRDVLELARAVFPPEGHPLRDGRVRVHVEDGRQWLLQAADGTYDLITGEPPPPRNAGVVNLYAREHFELMRRRLRPGGVATYWLPVHSLSWPEAMSIVRSFCDAFDDCTLWKGFGFDWMLAGSNGGVEPPGAAGLAAAWNDPGQKDGLEAIGLDTPATLGATFLADATVLRGLFAPVPPLVDDWPHRLSPHAGAALDPRFARFMGAADCRRRFEASAWVSRVWPQEVWASTLAAFDDQDVVDRLSTGVPLASTEIAERILYGRRSPFIWLWLAGANAEVARAAREAAARGERDASITRVLAADALGRGEAERAGRLWSELAADQPGGREPLFAALSYCLAGEEETAHAAWQHGRLGPVPAWLASCGTGLSRDPGRFTKKKSPDAFASGL